MVEPILKAMAATAIATRAQVSLYGVVQALIVAGITATVTSYATVTRVDKRLDEMIAEVRDIRMQHDTMRERLSRSEQKVDDAREVIKEHVRVGNGNGHGTPAKAR